MKKKNKMVIMMGMLFIGSCMFINDNEGPKASVSLNSESVAQKISKKNKANTMTTETIEVLSETMYSGELHNRTIGSNIPIVSEKPKVKVYKNKCRNLKLSKTEYQVLLNIVEAEATGGTLESKMMVANVVLNRVADSHFPNSVSEVVFQRCSDGTPQFSPTTDGRYGSLTISDSTKKAVKKVLNGTDISHGALFFVNRNSASSHALSWFDSKLKYMFECGGHSYYCYR